MVRFGRVEYVLAKGLSGGRDELEVEVEPGMAFPIPPLALPDARERG
jgi:hypothetical protein